MLASEAARPGDGQGRAVARDPRGQRGRLREAESETVHRRRLPAVATLRIAVGGDHRGGAGQEPSRRRDRTAEAPLDRPLEEDAEEGRRQERESEHPRLAPVEGAKLFQDDLPLADQERCRRAGVQRHPERLLQVGVLPVPAEEPGHQREVCGARDRQKLGRSLDRAEDDRPRRPHQDSAAGATRPRRRFQSANAISTTIPASTA